MKVLGHQEPKQQFIRSYLMKVVGQVTLPQRSGRLMDPSTTQAFGAQRTSQNAVFALETQHSLQTCESSGYRRPVKRARERLRAMPRSILPLEQC